MRKTKQKVRRGWGLLQLSKRGIRVEEVVVGKSKPHYDEFYEGEPRSKIIPVMIIYDLPKPSKRDDYRPRSRDAQESLVKQKTAK